MSFSRPPMPAQSDDPPIPPPDRALTAALGDLEGLLGEGKNRRAVQFGRKLVRAYPEVGPARLALAKAYAQDGQVTRAISQVRTAVEIDAMDRGAWLCLGDLLAKQGACEDAISCYMRILTRHTDQNAALLGLGRSYLALKNFKRAAHYFGLAIKSDSKRPQTYFDLGRAFCGLEQTDRADACFDIYVRLGGNTIEIQLVCARALLAARDARRAALRLESVQASGPKDAFYDAETCNLLGTAYRMLGDATKAKDNFLRAHSLAPENASYTYNLSTVYTPASHQEVGEKLAKVRSDATWGRACSGFARGAWLEKLGAFEDAYESYCAANAAQFCLHRLPDYRPVPEPGEWAKRLRAASCDEAAHKAIPIFIVGLPRSGTTLLETQIAQKTGARAMGERDWVARALQASKDDLDRFGAHYLEQVPDVALQAGVFIDKMPQNYKVLGALIAGLPNARVVHVSRDYRAVGWSIFKHFFTSGGPAMHYSFSQQAILEECAAHQRTMRAWTEACADKFISIRYEDIVADTAKSFNTIVDKLDLPHFFSAENPVPAVIQTASAEQARRPIYSGANAGWTNFERFAPDWFAQLARLEETAQNERTQQT